MTPRFDGFPLRRRTMMILILVVAAALTGAVILLSPGRAGTIGAVIGIAAALVQASALWWIERRPWLVLIIVTLGSAVLQLLYPQIGPGAALAALFAMAGLRPPRSSVWALLIVASFAPVQAVASGWRDGLITAAAAVLAWAFGELNRIRGSRRQALADFATATERARISRELHDVVAHHVSVVVVQAAAADDVFDSQPQRAREAIRAIEATGRQALAELRRVVLTDPVSPTPPAPGLAELDELAAAVRAAGVSVTVDREVRDPIDAEVALTAHRIVQESLTNVVRHAGASAVTITVRLIDAALEVEVIDNGTGGSTTSSGGSGIAGMRQRAESLGGTVTTQAGPGGFVVRSTLPVSS